MEKEKATPRSQVCGRGGATELPRLMGRGRGWEDAEGKMKSFSLERLRCSCQQDFQCEREDEGVRWEGESPTLNMSPSSFKQPKNQSPL